MRTKTELTIPEMIYDALKNHTAQYEDGDAIPFLSTKELAAEVFNGAYNKYTRKPLEEKVRRNVYGAMRIAIDNGELILSKKNKKLKGNKIDSWKLATQEDTEFMNVALEHKIKLANGHTESLRGFANVAESKGMLPEAQKHLIGN